MAVESTSGDSASLAKRIGLVLGATVLGVFLSLAGMAWWFDGDKLANLARERVEAQTGLSLETGVVTRHFGTDLRIRVKDLKLLSGDTDGPQPILTADTVEARLPYLALLQGKVRTDRVTVDAPTLHLTELEGLWTDAGARIGRGWRHWLPRHIRIQDLAAVGDNGSRDEGSLATDGTVDLQVRGDSAGRRSDALLFGRFRAALLDGSIEGVAKLFDLGNSMMRFEVSANVNRIRAAELLEAAGSSSKHMIAGIAATVDLSSTAGSAPGFSDGLQGTVTIVIDGGRLSDTASTLLDPSFGTLLVDAIDADSQTPIRCGIVALNGEQGVFHSDAILLDTGVAKLVGEGSVDVSQGTLDVLLVPHGKDFDLMSATAPVQIKGSIASPDVSLAAGRTLSALLTPVDLGFTDNADCRDLVSSANKVFADAR